ncbi:DnaJ C-terminal domain-containing protein [uncultured Massilia sp.]|uniref:DnaJ C-terminal domain-containing protein n=1 Tax=uncultured Massilia sp. TaxID=169973 RepID=UPI0025DAF8B9|nr:DnaJ C-terminal domain-containing protein [uncultured Massilia sp.]
MEYKDYYQTLGVDKAASQADIKKAYRKLVRQYHPDVSKHKDADAKTKELNEAYDVLGDAEKRAAYDELGKAPRGGQGGFQPPPDWGTQFDFAGAGSDDFFNDLFAHVGRRTRAGGAGAGAGGGFRMPGEDVHATITIDLRDAYQGATRTIALRVPRHDEQGRTTMQEKTLSVNIPKGVTPGQQLRLSGQGHPGAGGGASGDLYLEIQFAPDARYRVEGTHVYQNVPVTPWEAALGASIPVQTPSGTVEVTVPPGSQGGRKLRLKGRGIPAAQPGDLYLILEVVLPPASSERARALYEQMARDLAFNPRERVGA